MSDALKEAYASAPADELTLDTIELHHPGFVDSFGNPTAVRLVQAMEDHTCTLEAAAPLNANQAVLFRACAFNFVPSGFGEDDVPSLQLTISNVSREITKYLEMAIALTDPIVVYYRPYLLSDKSHPQSDPVVRMTLTNVSAGVLDITGSASVSDVNNWPFPNKKYTPAKFPGLVR